MPQIKKKCKCGRIFFVYPYREKTVRGCSRSCAAKFSVRPKGYKSPKGSLAKLGNKNPMWGKNFTVEHRKKIGEGNKQFYIRNPEKRLEKRNKVFGRKSPTWLGDKVGKDGVHDWIKKIKGKAEEYPCRLKDSTCKGKKEWSNRSQKYLRRIYDWQVLCKSHHMRYDMVMLPNWKKNTAKTQFKKGQIPWNKK